MTRHTIGFIGGGNMAYALIGGLLTDGFSPQNIYVTDPEQDKLATLAQQFRVNTGSDNNAAVANCDIVVLAVKPQVLAEVARGIAQAVNARKSLVVSIAAGVRVADLQRWLGEDAAIVRCMPNTPALVKTAATALYANNRVADSQLEAAESVLRAVGLAVWVDDENLLDAVTALSGSGPAYFFLFMEAMESAGRELGLDADTARLLTQQTALGAAKIAIESSESPEMLRRRVTSPGGTTEQAVLTLEQGGLRNLVQNAMQAALRRSVAMSDQFGAQ
ncbi:MAG: pyrroline-5-carboxylate reductase [Methylococcaceae bacterium]|nr:MAG: pyrroline-5-carboxylate reductase [Methylococcaceae bacterium]